MSYSHRVIPRGLSPDQDVVDLEGGVWATFLSDNPVFPATADTSLHQISELVYKHFFPWNWSEPFEVRFVDDNNDTISVVAAPEPVFPFDPSIHGVSTINLHTAPANLWDPEIGIYVWGNDYNFLQSGSEWERPATMDFHDPSGNLLFSEPVGLRINGNYSRYLEQKGLRFYFDDYGQSDNFEYDFFGSEPSTFQRILLRDNLAGHDWIKSNLAESIFQELGHMGSRYSLIHTYLNNEYWGTYSLRDRMDDEFFIHSLDWGGTDFVVLKDGEEEYGNPQLWYDFLESFSETTEFDSHHWFVSMSQQMDLVAYIDWLFINIFGATTDNGFRANVMIFREEGGPWTHLMWDEDMLFPIENQYSNHFRFYAAENAAEFTEFTPPRAYWVWNESLQRYCTMFNRLMRNSEFKTLFSNRVDELLGGPLSIAGWTSSIDELKAIQGPEVPLHAERWNWASPNHYFATANNIRNWIEIRHPVIVQQKIDFMEHFRAPVELSSFEAGMEGESVKLTWRTESEEDCQGFTLYRGTGSPESMVLIASYETNVELAGQGGIWQAAEYEFIDHSPLGNQSNYYQLHYTDFATSEEIVLNWVEEIWPSGWAGLKINELMGDNSSTIADDHGDFDAWVEIYNPLPTALSLGGLYLSNQEDNPQLWAFPDVDISAESHLLIWTDGEPNEGILHTSFRLTTNAGDVLLSGPNGIIDQVHHNAQHDDIAYGRLPDGSTNWVVVPTPTPGEANPIEAEFRPLVINEFLASNESGLQDETGAFEDWLEIYNPSDVAINLSGVFLSDDISSPLKWPLPDLEIPAGEYLVVFCDSDPEDGPLHTNFKLASNGEDISIYDAHALQFCDHRTFDPQTTDVSEGRLWDGHYTWTNFPAPTPGSSNGLPVSDVPAQASGPTSILSNYPNPFNPQTTLVFRLAHGGQTHVAVYDVRGLLQRALVKETLAAGVHEIVWDGRDASGRSVGSGPYFVQLRTLDALDTKRIMVLK